MDSIWSIIIIALAVVAAVSTIAALVGQRAPRVDADPERLARLRDRIAEERSRQRSERLEERVAEERDARTDAPQRRSSVTAERLWAGGF